MQVIYPRCAGLDVHQKTVVVTAMLTQQDGTVQREQRTFSTMTVDLLVLDDWLRQRQIDVIALESTGVYWRPVYTILEEGRTVILVNARHMKAVPGRKTDLKGLFLVFGEAVVKFVDSLDNHSRQTRSGIKEKPLP